MKKIIFSLIVALGAFASHAITVDEAYEKFTALPGAAISDVPEHQHIATDYGRLKDDMDWGKIVMLMGAPESVKTQARDIIAEITDEMVLDTMAQGSNKVQGFSRLEGDRTRAIVVIEMPTGIVAIYAQGGEDVISAMNIN